LKASPSPGREGEDEGKAPTLGNEFDANQPTGEVKEFKTAINDDE